MWRVAFEPERCGLDQLSARSRSLRSAGLADCLMERGYADAQLVHIQAIEDGSAVRLLGQLLLDGQTVLHGIADIKSRSVHPTIDIPDRIRERSGVLSRAGADENPTPRGGRLSALLYCLVEDQRAVAHTANAIDAHVDGIAKQLPQLALTVAVALEEGDRLEFCARGGRQRYVLGASAKRQNSVRDEKC